MELLVPNLPTPLQQLNCELLSNAKIELYVKRDDLIHPFVSGNKWRKLKYNLLDAREKGYKQIVTFGGAFSNHLYATAAAADALNMQLVGIIRGGIEPAQFSPTLKFCQSKGMIFHFVSREEYRRRNDEEYILELKMRYPDAYFIPEGGSSALALEGVYEIIPETESQLGFTPDFYAVAAGTGGTTAGLLSAQRPTLSFSALKGGAFLENDIAALLPNAEAIDKLTLFTDYHFGGYAKYKPELIEFIHAFKKAHGIQLEQVYTGKLFYGLYDLIGKGYFESNTRIVAIHTGGLQGCLPELLGEV